MEIKRNEASFTGVDTHGKKARKKPLTTAELFNIIFGILKEKGRVPDILEYWHEAYDPIPIMTYEYDLKNHLEYGGNEGIYLSLWIEYLDEEDRKYYYLGTLKTLREDREAMHIMAGFLADFIVEEYEYVNSHLDDFTWFGVDVDAFYENGEKVGGYTCSTMERALKRKDEMLKKYSCVVVRDNATRKTKKYKR